MKAFSNFHIMSNYIKQIKLDAKVRYFLELQSFFSVFLLSGENRYIFVDFLH